MLFLPGKERKHSHRGKYSTQQFKAVSLWTRKTMRCSSKYLFAFCACVILSLYSVFFFNPISLKPALQHYGKLDEVQDALQNDHGVFSLWNFEDKLLSKAIKTGNSVRMKNILRKALRDEDIKLVVLGGSNSAGGCLGADEKSLDGLYFRVFINWWNNYIGGITKAVMKEIQLAIGATGSYFYSYCYQTFLGAREKIDIVLIEVSVNDLNKSAPLEQLTRQVLTHPSTPAVLFINLVSYERNNRLICTNLECFGQTKLARYYNITSLSLRELFCHKEKGNWRAVIKNTTASDGQHLNVKAHALVATMMIKYVKSVFKEVISDINKGIGQVETKDIKLPKILLIKSETEILRQPLCWTGKTPDASKPIHHPSLRFKIVDNVGFSMCLKLKNKTKPLRPDAFGGWCGGEKFSYLKLSVFVPALKIKDVLTSSRSVTVMVMNERCHATIWLDNENNTAVYFSETYIGFDQVDTVLTRVKPGYHNLTVRTMCKGMFMVSGIFVGPPDFHMRFPH